MAVDPVYRRCALGSRLQTARLHAMAALGANLEMELEAWMQRGGAAD